MKRLRQRCRWPTRFADAADKPCPIALLDDAWRRFVRGFIQQSVRDDEIKRVILKISLFRILLAEHRMSTLVW